MLNGWSLRETRGDSIRNSRRARELEVELHRVCRVPQCGQSASIARQERESDRQFQVETHRLAFPHLHTRVEERLPLTRSKEPGHGGQSEQRQFDTLPERDQNCRVCLGPEIIQQANECFFEITG